MTRSHFSHSSLGMLALTLGSTLFLVGCPEDGEDGTSCSVVENADGSATIECTDGSSATVEPGVDGDDGTDGTDGDDGTNGTNGTDGEDGTDGVDGQNGLPAGVTPGIDLSFEISDPANGTHFVAGEQIVVSLSVTDEFGYPLAKSDLGTLALYMDGPRETTKMKSAVGLLRATTDRAATPHHFINLLTLNSADLVVDGNTWTYTLAPITTELPGTYRIHVNAQTSLPTVYPYDKAMEGVDVQIGTATAQTWTVTDGCDGCHLAEAPRFDGSDQYYFHHVDPSSRGAYGSPQYDSDPKNCWACHNTEGYASVQVCADGSVPDDSTGSVLCDNGQGRVRINDEIVRRVHGVHNGHNLDNPVNTDPEWGLFADYTEVGFPADVRTCTTCHADDAWKDKPSRLACGTCHDTVNFATGDGHGPSDLVQTNDEMCTQCHNDTYIETKHAWSNAAGAYAVTASMTEPDNEAYYTGSEAPVLSLTLTTSGGTPVNWADVTSGTWNRVYLFVYGPWSDAAPALTDVAALPTTNSDQYIDLRSPSRTETEARITRTANVLEYELDPVTTAEPGTYTVLVRMRKASSGEAYTMARYDFQVGTEDEDAPKAANCASCHGDTQMHGWLPFDDSTSCLACHDEALGLDAAAKTGWSDSAYGYGRTPISRYVHQFHFGHYLTDTTVPHYSSYEPVIFPKDVRNCTSCHEGNDAWNEEPNRIACTACHDTPATWVHVSLQTLDPTPEHPYNGDEQEACGTCHAGNSEFAPKFVHNVSDPYQVPYWREPVE